jgi:TonB family protein
MEYYNPNDNSTKRYAAIAVVLFMAILAFAVSFISISVTASNDVPVLIEFEMAEEEVTEEVKKVTPKPKPKERGKVSTIPAEVPKDSKVGAVETPEKPKVADKDPLVHTKEAETTQSAQVSGEDEKSQTLNNAALFTMSEETSTEEVAGGSHFDPLGDKETKKGEGKGNNPVGDDDDDTGDTKNNLGYAKADNKLEIRGYESLPEPRKIYTEPGEVVVRIKVNTRGEVVSAEAITLESTYDSKLWQLAEEAAKGAKFKPADYESEGTITYVFGIH